LQVDLDRRQLLTKAFVLDQWSSARHLLCGELAYARRALLGKANTRAVGALVAEQELGVVPALVFLADQIFYRHLHVSEEDLVDLPAAVDRHDRAHLDSGRFHVDEQERDALLRLSRGEVGAHEAEDPVGILGERRPGLLAVDDVVVALAYRPRLERS